MNMTINTFGSSNSLYGDFRYSLNDVDAGTNTTSSDNNASRLGFKGDFGDPEGITAFYNLQTGVNVDSAADAFSQRFFFAGIKGKFGKVAYGRTSTAYKMAGLRLDPFYDSSAGPGFGGANFGLSPLTNGWTDNSLTYTSPKLGHFTVNAAAFLDDSDEDEHDANVGILYKNETISAGFQYAHIADTGVIAKGAADSNAARFHVAARWGKWNFNASIEKIDVSQGNDQDYLYLSSTYKMSDTLKFAASVGTADDVSVTADGDGYSLGMFYTMPTRTVISLMYSTVDYDNGTDRDIFALGVSQKFSFK